MADPTNTEIQTTITNLCKLWWDHIEDCDGDVGQFDTIEQALEGDYIPSGVTSVLERVRAAWSAGVDPDLFAEAVSACWRDYGKYISAPEGEVGLDLLERIKRWMHEQGTPVTINRRDVTFATPSAGVSNQGDGNLVRCTVDQEDYTLDAVHLELHTAECVEDQSTGTEPGAEVFEFRGIERTKGLIGYAGSGFKDRFTCHHAGTGAGGSLLGNSSFDQTFSTTESSAKVPRWTIVGTTTNVTQETSVYFQAAPNSSQDYSVKFTGDAELTQPLTEASIDIDPTRPYMLDVPYKKSAAGVTGTLTIKCGGTSTNVDLSTVGDTDWHRLRLTLDKTAYYLNWKEDAPDIEIEVATLAVGNLYVDGVVFDQMDLWDGTYHWLVSGETPFLRRDVFTWTDALAGSDGRLAKFFWWMGFGSFPNATGGAETWADPA